MSIQPPQLTYVDPDGGQWPLSDLMLPNGYICTAITGVSGIPASFATVPLVDGGSLPQVFTPQPGSPAIGLYVEAVNGDMNAYMSLLDKLAYAFLNTRNGSPVPGWLYAQRQDGSSRKLAVYCVSGNDAPTDEGPAWSLYVFSLQSPDPYWYDIDPNTADFVLAGSGSGILPLLPVNLGSSAIIGGTTIDNDGGASAYPIWTITGPGQPTITNNSTGRQFGLSNTLSTGQQVQINTQPGSQYAIDIGSGANMWPSLVKSSPRDLWPLVVGINSVSLAMTGSGPGSKISLSWTRRWLRM